MADDTAKTRQKQKIALGVSGGIACYKSAEILRRLQDRGFDVVVIMTPNARRFVTPLTFAALSGNKVYSDMFEGASPGAAFEGSFRPHLPGAVSGSLSRGSGHGRLYRSDGVGNRK